MNEVAVAYGPDWTAQDRQEVRKHNIPIILGGFNKSPEVFPFSGNREKLEYVLAGLRRNQKVAEPLKSTDIYSLIIEYDKIFLITGIHVPGQQLSIATYSMPATIHRDPTDMGSIKAASMYKIGGSFPIYLKAREGNEGNGFGQGLIKGTETIISRWLRSVKADAHPIVVSLALSDSRFAGSTDEERGKDARSTWTPEMLSQLGYSNSPEMARMYLAQHELAVYKPERCFLKVWKDKSNGINLLK
jgi:hypothetical protein